MYAKIENDVVVEYPYFVHQLHEANPTVSFPSPIPIDILNDYGVVEVHPTAQPVVDYSKNVTEASPVLINGAYHQSWAISDKPAAEVSQIKKNLRGAAYRLESDPLFFKAQRGEASVDEWLAKVAEIKSRYPD